MGEVGVLTGGQKPQRSTLRDTGSAGQGQAPAPAFVFSWLALNTCRQWMGVGQAGVWPGSLRQRKGW